MTNLEGQLEIESDARKQLETNEEILVQANEVLHQDNRDYKDKYTKQKSKATKLQSSLSL